MSTGAPGDGAHLRGAARLAVDATLGLTDVVEAMHGGIGSRWFLRRPPAGRTSGITGGVYRSIRLTTRLVGIGLDAGLRAVEPRLAAGDRAAGRDPLLAVLNGVVGDHLAATANPLAIPLEIRHAGRRLPTDAAGLAAALPGATGRVVLMVHGLCRTDRQWLRNGHDHGAALGRDLGRTVLHARYNSGLHVSTNGRALAALLETVTARWPVPLEELAIVAHSMGGLVARSACHYAAEAAASWPLRLRHLVFVGTPHHGAPLERGGRWLQSTLGAAPFARPLARLGRLRSAGITDLRHGNLLDEDWQGRDRFASAADHRRPVPLPAGVTCCAVAATLATGSAGLPARLLGDGLVPLASALGHHPEPGLALGLPADRQWVGRGMGHLDLLGRPEVCDRIRAWLDDPPVAGAATRPGPLPRP